MDRLQSELNSALDALSKMEDAEENEEELRQENQTLSEEGKRLREENEILRHKLKQEEMKSRQGCQALTELQDISGRLQAEVLEMDKDRNR